MLEFTNIFTIVSHSNCQIHIFWTQFFVIITSATTFTPFTINFYFSCEIIIRIICIFREIDSQLLNFKHLLNLKSWRYQKSQESLNMLNWKYKIIKIEMNDEECLYVNVKHTVCNDMIYILIIIVIYIKVLNLISAWNDTMVAITTNEIQKLPINQ